MIDYVRIVPPEPPLEPYEKFLVAVLAVASIGLSLIVGNILPMVAGVVIWLVYRIAKSLFGVLATWGGYLLVAAALLYAFAKIFGGK